MNILCDIGGSKTRVAMQTGDDSFSEPIVFKTPASPHEAFRSISDQIKQVSDEPINTIAGGIAGVIDREGRILNSAHLKDWIGVDLVQLAEEELGAVGRFVNDAAVVGLGEAQYGAGKGREIVVYMTVSTGIGGARIVSGKVDEYAYGFEPGHQIIEYKTGATLERLASGSGFEARYGVKPYEVSDPEAWEEAANTLAVGVKNTIVYWSPDAVVLGGPMIVGDPAIPLDRVRDRVGELLKIIPTPPEILRAELKDFGGLYGALALLKEHRG